ncbi:GspH/FimT family pseudopilin [Salinicola aestuarinus]|uniref:GspH/FimT family pseudopilin n=1 Tax=Salinicola aestuarinus TaxID=1949082 RepID=UPI000DA22D15|nr:GspH/FimT family pseudopilin [Salinicola aestuarinus]
MPAKPQGQGGFTLLELLVVIVLVGVAASILAVGIGRGMHAAEERRTLADLVSGLRGARVEAITGGSPVQARFDLAGRRLEVAGQPTVTWPEAFELHLHTARELGAAFAFYPDGASSGGYVEVAHASRHWRIDIAWLTGRTQLQSLP